MSNFLNEEIYEISIWEDELITPKREEAKDEEFLTGIYNPYYSYFEEKKVAIIGANDMESKYGAFGVQLSEKTSGEKTLTFSLYYNLFDEDKLDFCNNPFVSLLSNEKKIKLFYKKQYEEEGEWYDFIIKTIQENSQNKTFTYTAKQLYINELGKNGFQVEFHSELENNQGTVTQLGKSVLAGTDWEVDSESEPIVETQIEPIYRAVVSEVDLWLVPVVNFMPNPNYLEEEALPLKITAGKEIYLFYSDLVEQNDSPMILYREDGNYMTDLNGDYIVNAYNYQLYTDSQGQNPYKVNYLITDDNYNIPTFIVSMRLETNFKGSKLIKSKVTAYDENRDRFVTKYVRVYLRQDDNGSYGFDNEKKEVFYIEDPNYQGFRYSKYIELENGEVKLYNGYEETSFIDSELAQNYLANSDNFTTVDTGWYFDTLTDVREEQAKLMSGQIVLENEIISAKEGNPFNFSTERFWTFVKDPEGKYIKTENGYVLINDYFLKNGETNGEIKVDTELLYTKKIVKNEALLKLSLRGGSEDKKEIKAINTGLQANKEMFRSNGTDGWAGIPKGEEMVFAISLGEVEWIKNQNGELLSITPEPKIFIGDTNINPDVVDSEQKIYYGSVKFDGAYSREEIEASETIFKEAWIEELARRNLSYGFNLNRDGYMGGIQLILNGSTNKLLDYFNKQKIGVAIGGELYLNKLFGLLAEIALEKDFHYSSYIKEYQLSKMEMTQQHKGFGSFEEYLYQNNFDFSKYFETSETTVNQLKKCRVKEPVIAIRTSEEQYNLGKNSSFRDQLFTIAQGEYLYYDNKDGYFYYGADNASPYYTLNEINYLKGYKCKVISPFTWTDDFPSFSEAYQENTNIYQIAYNDFAFKDFGIVREGFISEITSHYKTFYATETEPTAEDLTYFENLYNWLSIKGEKYSSYCLFKEEMAKQKYFSDLEIYSDSEKSKMNSWAPTELTILELLWCQRISDLTYSGLNSGGLLELETNPYFHLIINNLRWNKYIEMTQDKIYVRKTALLKPTESQEVEAIEDATNYRILQATDNFVSDVFGYDEEKKTYYLISDLTELQPSIYIPIEAESGNFYYDVEKDEYLPYTDSMKQQQVYNIAKGIESTGQIQHYPVRYRLEAIPNIENSEDFGEGLQYKKLIEATGKEMGTTYVLGKNVKNKMISLFQEATYTLFSLLNLQISFNKESMIEIDTWLKNLNYPSLSTIYSSIFNGISLENGILILPYNNTKLYIDTKETLEGQENLFKIIIEEIFSNLDNYTSIFEDNGEKFKIEFEDPAFTPRKWEILNKEIILSYIRILFNSYEDFGFSLEQQIENLMSINTPALIFTKVKEGSGVLKTINGAFTVTINGEEKSYNNCDEYYKDLFSIEEEEILIPYNSLNYRHQDLQRYKIGSQYCLQNTNNGNISYIPTKTAEIFKKQGYEIVCEGSGKTVKNYLSEHNIQQPIITIPQVESFELKNYSNQEIITYLPYKAASATGFIKDGNIYRQLREGENANQEQYAFQHSENGTHIYVDNIFKPFSPTAEQLKKTYYYEPLENGATYTDEHYVFYNGTYIPISIARTTYQGAIITGYNNLKVGLCSNYNYDSTDFNISEYEPIPHLQFDCSKKIDGTYYVDKDYAIDDEGNEHFIKEKWIYWVASAKEDINFEAPEIEKIGVLFSSKEKELKDYIFRGISLFKKYEYEEKITDSEEKVTYQPRLVHPDFTLNTDNYYVTKFYIYDPQKIEGEQYEYCGFYPERKVTESQLEGKQWIWEPYYDEQCNKIRSIEGKESSYFGLIQKLLEEFECWAEYIIEHDEYGRVKYKDTFVLEEFIENNNNIKLIREQFSNAIENGQETQVYREEILLILSEYGITQTNNNISVTLLNDKELLDVLEELLYSLENDLNYNEENSQLKLEKIAPQVLELIPLGDGKYTLGKNKKLYDISENIEGLLTEVNEENLELIASSYAEEDYDQLILYGSLSSSTIKAYEEMSLSQNSYIGAKVEQGELHLTSTEGQDVFDYEKKLPTIPLLVKVVYQSEIDIKDEEDADKKQMQTYIRIFRVRAIKTPIKKIKFRQYIGNRNASGFKYGINLGSIQRNLVSDNTVSKLIVKTNTNEFANNGFCTIQRAKSNYTKENFIYNFDYYVNHKMLDYGSLLNDLYSLSPEGVGYYYKIATINRQLNELADKVVAIKNLIDSYSSELEVINLTIQSADEKINEIKKMILQTPYLTDEQKASFTYDNWVYLQSENQTTENRQGTLVSYYSYNDQIRGYMDQMDIFCGEKFKNETRKAIVEQKLETQQKELKKWLIRDDIASLKKTELNKLFYLKYSRFIQEGSWSSEEYIDDELYYLDASSVLYNSIFPKIAYTINVVDYSMLEEYKIFNFKIGERTYIEDTEFFGYNKNGTPYWEEVVITETIRHLGDPSKNSFKVQNFTTQYEDLFSRITATVQSLQFNNGNIGGAGAALIGNITNGSIANNPILGFGKGEYSADEIIAMASKQYVSSNDKGITVSGGTGEGVIKILNSGIYISSDGSHFKPVITQQGLNISDLLGGVLNIEKIIITSPSSDGSISNFLWDKYGISSFAKNPENNKEINYNKFVRYDEYGMYGILNQGDKQNSYLGLNNKDNEDFFNLEQMVAASGGEKTALQIIKENAVFGLTWEGFFFNTGDKLGRVLIDSSQDLRMQTRAGDLWQDQLIIGKLNDGEKPYYGFRLLDTQNRVVLDTNQNGELYLRKKLRISNFEDIYNSSEKEDRVTLGIVKTYSRADNLSEVELNGPYQSDKILTKVFSIKANSHLGVEPWTEQMLSCIENNEQTREYETFVILDNGNFYAKNAWIEGSIRATSGNILGTLILGEDPSQEEQEFIKIDGKNGVISGGILTSDTSDYFSFWEINSDGSAKFTNAYVSGVLGSAVFGKNTIQASGGSIIVSDSCRVAEVLYTEDQEIKLNIETSESSISQFAADSYCLIGYPEGGQEVYQIAESIFEVDKLKLRLLKQGQTETITKGSIIIPLGSIKEGVSDKFIIGINATSFGSWLPNNGISIVQTAVNNGQIGQNVKLMLGDLSEVVSSLKTNYELSGYGLYCDNAYLKGSLILENDEVSAGVSTQLSNQEEAIFWAGPVQEKTFYVTKDGYLYAANGFFSGTINASIIQAAKIYGKDASKEDLTIGTSEEYNNYGLTIIGSNGIVAGEEVIKDGVIKLNPYFLLGEEGMKLKVKAEFEEETIFNSVKFNSNKKTYFEMKTLPVKNTEGEELVFSFLKEGNSVINFTRENTQIQTNVNLGTTTFIDNIEDEFQGFCGFDLYIIDWPQSKEEANGKNRQ